MGEGFIRSYSSAWVVSEHPENKVFKSEIRACLSETTADRSPEI